MSTPVAPRFQDICSIVQRLVMPLSTRETIRLVWWVLILLLQKIIEGIRQEFWSTIEDEEADIQQCPTPVTVVVGQDVQREREQQRIHGTLIPALPDDLVKLEIWERLFQVPTRHSCGA
ncbi:hypothetical protein R1flu_017567 [Riccia fluitans]|uniref:Uncharacterized protein n=1 Tax=Riccia fluitans TaxID=41844 RepID=A0ABD1ZDC6_9MARC